VAASIANQRRSHFNSRCKFVDFAAMHERVPDASDAAVPPPFQSCAFNALRCLPSLHDTQQLAEGLIFVMGADRLYESTHSLHP
jgi:hypothetical protein